MRILSSKQFTVMSNKFCDFFGPTSYNAMEYLFKEYSMELNVYKWTIKIEK